MSIYCRLGFAAFLIVARPLVSQAAASPSSTDLCGSDQNWRYSPLASACYLLLAAGAPTNRSLASSSCSAMSARLPQPGSETEIDGLRQTLNSVGFGSDQVWLGADNSSGSFAWINVSTPIADSLWLSDFGPNSGASTGGGSGGITCVTLKTQLTAHAGWVQANGLAIANCTGAFSIVCEKPVPKCDPSGISGFDTGTMTATNVTNGKAYYNLFNIGLESSLDCLPGFYRERDSPTATVPMPTTSSNGQSVNTVLCGYSMSGSNYSPVVKQGVVEQCYPIRCATAKLKTEFRIPNVEPYESKLAVSHFNYSQRFYVTCSRGYVSYKNTSAITSPVECGQNYKDPTVGEWIPFDLNTCQAVKCPDISGYINTEQAVAYKADNRINQKQYTEFQSSSYPYYPNRVYIKCATAGYFFDDRQFEKTIGCDLLNGSLIEGAWTGVLGTKLALLKTTECIEVSCDTDILIPKTAAGAEMLASLNYKSTAVISFNNGTVVTTNASKVNAQELMPYKTVMAFSCLNGMDTGTGSPIALCRSSGDWNISSLPTCTKVSGAIDVRGKFFVPPAVEAASAGSVGALAITISVLFGISLLMLDLSTLSRDIALMKRNLGNVKRRLKVKRARR